MTGLERRVAGLSATARVGLAALGGAALALSQPPVSWPLVLFLAMPLLAWLLDAAASPRGAFAVGWAAGAGFFGAGLFWIVDPFLVQPEIFGWMAPFAVTGMAGGLALFWAVPFALARALRPPGLARVLALAALWALSDYARAHVLTGFPWALPAYAWVETPVIQLAALGGPFLLGLLTLVAGLLPALGSWRAVAVAAAMVAAGWGFGAWRLAQPLPVRAEPLVVRLVQPNAVQAEKWLPGKEQEFWDRHIALTRGAGRSAAGHRDLVGDGGALRARDAPRPAGGGGGGGTAGAARHRHRAGGGGGGGRAVLQLARGARRGRERGRGLRQAPPCPVRRIHPLCPGGGAARAAGAGDADPRRLHRRAGAAPGRSARGCRRSCR